MKTRAEVEWDEKYGSMTKLERDRVWKDSLSDKIDEMKAMRDERYQKEQEAQRSITYPKIVRAIPEAQKRIQSLEGKPEKMAEAKKKALNKEFDKEVKYERMSESRRALWVSDKLVKWMRSDEEYIQTKSELAQARNDYSRYVALKAEWEKENADIIEAERTRSRRAELLQANPDTLRALGITPDPSFVPSVSPHSEDPQKEELRKALKAIHPSASDTEIEGMLKSV